MADDMKVIELWPEYEALVNTRLDLSDPAVSHIDVTADYQRWLAERGIERTYAEVEAALNMRIALGLDPD